MLVSPSRINISYNHDRRECEHTPILTNAAAWLATPLALAQMHTPKCDGGWQACMYT